MTRTEIVALLKPFARFGDPAALSLINSEDAGADAAWRKLMDYQNENWGAETEEGSRERLETIMVPVDAGFRDADFLDELANDILFQELETAQQKGYVTAEKEIEAKIAEIKELMK